MRQTRRINYSNPMEVIVWYQAGSSRRICIQAIGLAGSSVPVSVSHGDCYE